MRELLAAIERAAASELPVLIQGETGTGKELVARAVHKMSSRAGQAFVAVHCGAVPESQMEGELFGQEKGALAGTPAASAACWSWRRAASSSWIKST